jgi:hypothetical protein
MTRVIWVKGVRSIVPEGKSFFTWGYRRSQKNRLLGHERRLKSLSLG